MDVNNSTTLGKVKVIMLKGEKGDIGDAGNYATLQNKPSINGVTLTGDKTSSNLSLASKASVDAINASLAYETASVEVTVGEITTTISARKKNGVVQASFSFGSGAEQMPFANITGNIQIGTMPVGFRPTSQVFATISCRTEATWSNASYFIGTIHITTDGTISLYFNSNEIRQCRYVEGYVVYPERSGI